MTQTVVVSFKNTGIITIKNIYIYIRVSESSGLPPDIYIYIDR